jgi:hypothetical protein
MSFPACTKKRFAVLRKKLNTKVNQKNEISLPGLPFYVFFQEGRNMFFRKGLI